MGEIIKPQQNILFMKIGIHAEESLDDIIARKTKEIEDTGFALWGYGGNTCHPTTKVQPFANAARKQGKEIYLCMHAMDSKHFADPIRASQFSPDGKEYQSIPDTINVLGSRFALAISNLEEEAIELPLDSTEVAIGECKGRSGDKYIKGRVDKACLTISDTVNQPIANTDNTVTINYVAKLREPYAYFLKN